MTPAGPSNLDAGKNLSDQEMKPGDTRHRIDVNIEVMTDKSLNFIAKLMEHEHKHITQACFFKSLYSYNILFMVFFHSLACSGNIFSGCYCCMCCFL